VVDNLQEAVLRGEESHGMLLAASDSGGIVLLRPDRDCEAGAMVK
jgi:tRNA-binding EMAP/Myf-like protein